jgi:hypothetical protein
MSNPIFVQEISRHSQRRVRSGVHQVSQMQAGRGYQDCPNLLVFCPQSRCPQWPHGHLTQHYGVQPPPPS